MCFVSCAHLWHSNTIRSIRYVSVSNGNYLRYTITLLSLPWCTHFTSVVVVFFIVFYPILVLNFNWGSWSLCLMRLAIKTFSTKRNVNEVTKSSREKRERERKKKCMSQYLCWMNNSNRNIFVNEIVIGSMLALLVRLPLTAHYSFNC